MPARNQDRKWILAVLAAVLVPALALHGTCIAVMGPGTWGSGVAEVAPEFQPPTDEAMRYAEALEPTLDSGGTPQADFVLPGAAALQGSAVWVDRAGGRTVILTEDSAAKPGSQRLYVAAKGDVRELALPRDHVVSRPQWVGDRIVYERWNPWAIPPLKKLGRYLASWTDRTLRPEVALYGSADEDGRWDFLMPGHSLSIAPDGRRAALLRSGALLAGYYSIHVWRLGADEAPAILSLREHGELGPRSFSLRWSPDSAALRIAGKTAGFGRRQSQTGAGADGLDVDVLYLAADQALYDLRAKP